MIEVYASDRTPAMRQCHAPAHVKSLYGCDEADSASHARTVRNNQQVRSVIGRDDVR